MQDGSKTATEARFFALALRVAVVDALRRRWCLARRLAGVGVAWLFDPARREAKRAGSAVAKSDG